MSRIRRHRVVTRTITDADRAGRVQFSIEYRTVLIDEARQAEEELRRNPQLAQAVTKLLSLRMQAQLFGFSEQWIQAQLTDADRAALAQPAEAVAMRQLPEPEPAYE